MTDTRKFKDDCLKAHNVRRSVHGAPALQLSEDLSSKAQQWADTLAEKGYPLYSENPGFSENIAFVTGTPSGEDVTKQWYEEAKNYNFDKPVFKRNAVHFTRLIWRGSNELGVGVAKLPNKDKHVIVVNYRPPGNTNFSGDFPNNVKSPLR